MAEGRHVKPKNGGDRPGARYTPEYTEIPVRPASRPAEEYTPEPVRQQPVRRPAEPYDPEPARQQPAPQQPAARRPAQAYGTEPARRPAQAYASRPAQPPQPVRRPAAEYPPQPPRAQPPRRKKSGLTGLLLVVLFLFIAVLAVVLILKHTGKGQSASAAPSAAPATAQAAGDAAAAGGTAAAGDTAAPDATAEPSPTAAPTATPIPEGDAAKMVDGYIAPADWGVVVPERSAPVYDSFFDHACMIGNSLMDGFKMWSGMSNCHYITHANMWAKDVLTQGYLYDITVNSYDSIYILLGLNEIGASVASFIDSYGAILDYIRSFQPTATIYVVSVTPVTAAVDADPNQYATMKQIDLFNSKLQELCAEKGCWYLDVYSILVNGDGFLDDYYAYDDGEHFEKSGYVAWADYMKTHYVDSTLLGPQ